MLKENINREDFIEENLQEIVKLVGMDALSSDDRLTIEIARSIREDFLQQNAFEDVDCYTELEKQLAMIKRIFAYESMAKKAIDAGADIEDVSNIPAREAIGRYKAVPFANYKAEYDKIVAQIKCELDELVELSAERI